MPDDIPVQDVKIDEEILAKWMAEEIARMPEDYPSLPAITPQRLREMAAGIESIAIRDRSAGRDSKTFVVNLAKVAWLRREAFYREHEEKRSAAELLDQKAQPGPRGAPGLRGEPGPIGPMPEHEWSGTELRFEIEPGVWGEWVDLEGPKGKDGTQIGMFGAGSINLDALREQLGGTTNSYFPSGW